MKLIAVGVILAVVALKCILTVTVAATVGLYAPDRYEGIPEMCLMPMDFGYCRAKVKRYYFDMRRMKCAMFYWGGCAGNNNNFKSLDECNKYCLDAIDDDNADDNDNDDVKFTNNNNNNYNIRNTFKNNNKVNNSKTINNNNNNNNDNNNLNFTTYSNFKNSNKLNKSFNAKNDDRYDSNDYEN